MTNSALGGCLGMLGTIYACSKLGTFNFLLLSILIAYLTYASYEMLCRAAERASVSTTRNLAYKLLGKKGLLITECLVLIGNWSFIINILQLFADFLPQILQEWTHNEKRYQFCQERAFDVMCGLILIFPWVLVRNISKLEKLSYLSVLCTLFCLFSLVANTIYAYRTNKNNITNHTTNSGSPFFSYTTSFFLGLPNMTWSWSSQFNAIPIYYTLHPQKRYSQITA
ncbi:hypothetical protein RFI_26803, partial [Reticulomyxa filosa]